MAGPILAEQPRPSDWLVYEEDGASRYSREQGVLTPGTYPSGAVLGKTAGGNLQWYDDETTVDAGGAVAVGVLVYATTVPVGGTTKVAYIARHAKVVSSKLAWKSGLGDPAKVNAVNDLAALGIIDTPSV